jgi:hypothetical protein
MHQRQLLALMAAALHNQRTFPGVAQGPKQDADQHGDVKWTTSSSIKVNGVRAMGAS